MGDRRKNREARPDTALKLDKIKNSCKSTDSTYFFTTRLQDIRKERGLTQKEAAEGLNMQLNTYRKLEQGVNRSDAAEYIRTLADFYDVSADHLLGRDLTEPLNYDTVTEKTGLNSRSINQLIELHLQDGADISPGYMDFVNCFLGNGECTALFFQSLMPLLDSIYRYKYSDLRSDGMASITSHMLNDLIFDYVNKVVIPTYGQLRETGNFKPIPEIKYLTERPSRKE